MMTKGLQQERVVVVVVEEEEEEERVEAAAVAVAEEAVVVAVVVEEVGVEGAEALEEEDVVEAPRHVQLLPHLRRRTKQARVLLLQQA